ncbi:pfkB family carbohydrate kinase [Medicago truncatula]|uniref:PfkB family carbohydrate kinase n=1 Tax=Medicago truncatula TaxID=3880 RepID=G7JSU1_MEDTR|nr:pfkB family carbohydrate kinase [Medicago truncatula]
MGCFRSWTSYDFSGTVDEEFLKNLGLEKGTRKLVNHEERGRVLQAMDGCSYKAAAGGSLSNTLVALARLGGRSLRDPAINVAMAGSVASDLLGGFYREKLRRANVQFLSAPIKDATTGTVIVLTTPDAQRTMLAYQGTSSTVNFDTSLASAVSKTNILVVEGYLFELPDTIKAITKACKEARSNGALVAVTASDVTCIERHYDHFWEIVGNYADLIFANADEARALCNFDAKESTVSVTRYLSQFVPLVSVTDGLRGSYIGVKGEAVYIPPSPCVPVDTCGAGDAYASGILYGVLRGVSDLRNIGTIAAKVAATVVAQQGTRLRISDAVKLAESFEFQLDTSVVRSDIGTV